MLSQKSAISYTQWEAYLAILHDKRLFIAEPEEKVARESSYCNDSAKIKRQSLHRDRLKALDRCVEITFAKADDITIELLLTEVGKPISPSLLSSSEIPNWLLAIAFSSGNN